jgi:hypothetical protein
VTNPKSIDKQETKGFSFDKIMNPVLRRKNKDKQKFANGLTPNSPIFDVHRSKIIADAKSNSNSQVEKLQKKGSLLQIIGN